MHVDISLPRCSIVPRCRSDPQSQLTGRHTLQSFTHRKLLRSITRRLSADDHRCKQHVRLGASALWSFRRFARCQATAGGSLAPDQFPDSMAQDEQQQPQTPLTTARASRPRQLDDKVKDFFYFKSSNLLEFFEEAIKLPKQLTYPTPKELLWKGCLIMLSIMVLMVIISTIDTTFLYFVVKLMRKTA